VTSASDRRRRARVLIACSGLGHVSRGYETASQELARVLCHAVRTTLFRGWGPWLSGPGLRLPCLHRFGPEVKLFGLSGEGAYTFEQRTFAPWVYALACLGRFDVVHLHDPALLNAVWHARRKLGGRFAIVFTNGGLLSPEHLGRPDLVQSLTPVDAERLLKAGLPERRVAMVPYGLPPAREVNRSFVDGPPRTIVGVGTLNDTNKGFATAVRAVALVPGVSLRLLGQSDEETPGIEALGRAQLGDRFSTATLPPQQVPAALAEADAFVLPTHNEGFGLAVLEALAAGLPCVISDIPVLRWLAGDAGVFVPPDHPEEWASAIRGLTAERRRELSGRARRRAAELSWESLIGDYVAMYEKALETRDHDRKIS